MSPLETCNGDVLHKIFWQKHLNTFDTFNPRMLSRDMFDTCMKHVSADLYLKNMRTKKSIFQTGVN